MKRLALFSASALLMISTSAFSAEPMNKNPVSVHVLNLETGVPTSGIHVELDKLVEGKWNKLASGVTDNNGRISALFPQDKKAEKGTYQVIFKTGDYYDSRKQKTFFPQIPVMFTMEDNGHYHIPLLMSPFGYSTYRGN